MSSANVCDSLAHICTYYNSTHFASLCNMTINYCMILCNIIFLPILITSNIPVII